jgi:hypothetical protein
VGPALACRSLRPCCYAKLLKVVSSCRLTSGRLHWYLEPRSLAMYVSFRTTAPYCTYRTSAYVEPWVLIASPFLKSSSPKFRYRERRSAPNKPSGLPLSRPGTIDNRGSQSAKPSSTLNERNIIGKRSGTVSNRLSVDTPIDVGGLL